MSGSTFTKRATGTVLALLAALAMAACGGSGGQSRSSSMTGPLLADHPCLKGVNAETVSIPDGAQPLEFAVLGSGTRAVITSNQSDQDFCPWEPFAETLAQRGFRVVLYDYAIAPEYDLPMISTYLRGHGATAVALLGASMGGMGTIVAAASMQPAPQAVLTLSAESNYGGKDVVPYAAKITSPVLFVVAKDDDGPANSPTNPQFYRACPAKVKKLDVVPGAAHGTALLTDKSIVTELTAFLAAHDR